MNVYEVNAWTRTVEIITNRVNIINQMLGYGVDGSLDNPCQLDMRRGRYLVTYFGVEFASYGVYDQRETDAALLRLDALNDGIWYMLRHGAHITT